MGRHCLHRDHFAAFCCSSGVKTQRERERERKRARREKERKKERKKAIEREKEKREKGGRNNREKQSDERKRYIYIYEGKQSERSPSTTKESPVTHHDTLFLYRWLFRPVEDNQYFRVPRDEEEESIMMTELQTDLNEEEISVDRDDMV